MFDQASRKPFREFFAQATGLPGPYPFQQRLALEVDLPDLLDIPTGLGKTAAAILAWVWRRRFDPREAVRAKTPRRLVYCLPMRVLVEQTYAEAIKWLSNLDLLAGRIEWEDEQNRKRIKQYYPDDRLSTSNPVLSDASFDSRISVRLLMGGIEATAWDRHPDRDTIVIGTQDMLLSRALNRGYGMSRYRWPVHFGLLNNDSLWVIDEVQLMGSGLATTAQLQAFRRELGTFGHSRTVWTSSATVSPDWLHTVDFRPEVESGSKLSLGADDKDMPAVAQRLQASKRLQRSNALMGDTAAATKEILRTHRPATRTLVVVNTVNRAVELHATLLKAKPEAELVLVHSRFRPPDRRRVVEALLAEPGSDGTIVVSTQVVEAGVDVSATAMFTELAPWASLVQRFGRCNRAGQDADAAIYWFDLPEGEKSAAKLAPPYDPNEMLKARGELLKCDQAGPAFLPAVSIPFKHGQVVRKKDLIELFDTTPDLAGYDIDISRFIRESPDQDVQVFWRDLPNEGPASEEPAPHRDELCAAPIGDIRDVLKKKAEVWRRDALEGSWTRVTRDTPISPGLTLMLRASDGRYKPAEGWSPKSRAAVPVILPPVRSAENDYDQDVASENPWQSIAQHSDEVVKKVTEVAEELGLPELWRAAVCEAARWHDAGKAHVAFQAKLKPEFLAQCPNPPAAKAPSEAWRRGPLSKQSQDDDLRRKHFRHELVSAILALLHGRSDLVSYLVAAHHGKVRLAIRSFPDEYLPPGGDVRFARGVWEGDQMPAIDLGGQIHVPATSIDLSFMELGETARRGPSWLARTLELRDQPELGPFRLALLETVLRSADERVSGGEA